MKWNEKSPKPFEISAAATICDLVCLCAAVLLLYFSYPSLNHFYEGK